MARPAGFRLNAAALRTVLLAKGLTLTEAADRSGRSLKTLSGLMHGDHCASDSTAAQIAEGLGVEIEALFPEAGRVFMEAPAAKAARIERRRTGRAA